MSAPVERDSIPPIGSDSALDWLLAADTDEFIDIIEAVDSPSIPDTEPATIPRRTEPYSLYHALEYARALRASSDPQRIGFNRGKQVPSMGADSALAQSLEDEESMPDERIARDQHEPFIPSKKDAYKDRLLDWILSNLERAKGWLGGKGCGLTILRYFGFPAPVFGILPVANFYRWCDTTFLEQNDLSPSEVAEIREKLGEDFNTLLTGIEAAAGKNFGDAQKPLFVAMRSGAPDSMPGLMRTIVNVGITPDTIDFLVEEIGEVQAWRAYYRLLKQLTAIDAMSENAESELIAFADKDQELRWLKQEVNRIRDNDSWESADGLKSKALDNAHLQLAIAAQLIFHSFLAEDAIEYFFRKGLLRGRDEVGTAIIMMEMVHATVEGSTLAGAGVAVTTDDLGNKESIVTFGKQKTGQEVVGTQQNATGTIEEVMPPAVQAALRKLLLDLHRRFGGRRQDVEFVCDRDGKIWLTQTRDEYLPPAAAFRYLFQLVKNGAITEDEASRFISMHQLNSLFTPYLGPEELDKAANENRILATGTSIGTGTKVGGLYRVKSGQAPALAADQNYILYFAEASDAEKFMCPPNVVGMIVGNASHGSHAARHLEQLGLPIICGVTLPESASGVVTIDSQSHCVVAGKVPLTASMDELLTEEEREIAQRWRADKRANPWKHAYLTAHNHPRKFAALARQHRDLDPSQVCVSLKGREYAVFNEVFDQDTRVPYEIVSYSADRSATIKEELRTKLKLILAEGAHATVRTGHSPAMAGSGPYVVFTDAGQVDSFLDNPDYSGCRWKGFDNFVLDQAGEEGKQATLTELLIGTIPKDKLSKEPSVSQDHCVYSLTIAEGGEIMITLIPGTSNLRDLEAKSSSDNTISVTFPANNMNEKRPVLAAVVGSALANNQPLRDRAERFLTAVVWRMFYQWLPDGLVERLAVIQDHLPIRDGYRIIVLEGQARLPAAYLNGETDFRDLRITERSEDKWMLWYGIKADQKI